jgi:hypothetical protein
MNSASVYEMEPYTVCLLYCIYSSRFLRHYKVSQILQVFFLFVIKGKCGIKVRFRNYRGVGKYSTS